MMRKKLKSPVFVLACIDKSKKPMCQIRRPSCLGSPPYVACEQQSIVLFRSFSDSQFGLYKVDITNGNMTLIREANSLVNPSKIKLPKGLFGEIQDEARRYGRWMIKVCDTLAPKEVDYARK